MVTALLQLYYGLAAVAPLPALLLRHLHDSVGLFVLWTFSLGVEFTVAKYTDFCLAMATSCILPPVCGVHLYPRWLDPLATSFGGTIQSIGSRILLVLPVPKDFKFVVEKSVGVLQRNVLRRAAPRRHVLRILNREGELTLQT
jgi:hypothetical protein